MQTIGNFLATGADRSLDFSISRAVERAESDLQKQQSHLNPDHVACGPVTESRAMRIGITFSDYV
jgi:hypothetical protein